MGQWIQILFSLIIIIWIVVLPTDQIKGGGY